MSKELKLYLETGLKQTIKEEKFAQARRDLQIKDCRADNETFVRNVPETADEDPPKGYSYFMEYYCDVGKEIIDRPVNPPKNCLIESEHITKEGKKADTEAKDCAHVRIKGISYLDDEAHLIPTCKLCNNRENEELMKVKPGTILVAVKMQKPHPDKSSVTGGD